MLKVADTGAKIQTILEKNSNTLGGDMTTPHIITCVTCNESFVFIRGVIDKCPKCKEQYKSHRDAEEEKEYYDCPLHGTGEGSDCPRC